MIKRIVALLTLSVCLSVPVFAGDIPSTPAPPPPPAASENGVESALVALLLQLVF